MDLTTIIGLLIAFGMIATSIVMSGGQFSSFVNVPSLLCVFGGTAGAVLICFPKKAIRRLPGVMLKGIRGDETNPADLIQQIVEMANVARRDGLLALDPKLDQIENRFVRRGVQLAIDGTRPDAIEDVLRADMEAMSLRHREGRAMFEQMGRFAPAFGLIGTLLGLVIMLGNVSDPATIGSGMAVALVTTVYGAVLANGSLLPMAEKLSQLSKRELVTREIALRGILAMQSGEHPRLIEQKLRSFLPPEVRASLEEPRSNRKFSIDDDRDAADSAPAWMVSYGDLMSLLLTLFVMLVSMSEIKQNDKFQGVADSLHEQFSLNLPASGGRDGELQPRHAALAVLAVAGRQARQKVMNEATGRNQLPSTRSAASVDTTGPAATPEKSMVEVSLRDDVGPRDAVPTAPNPSPPTPDP